MSCVGTKPAATRPRPRPPLHRPRSVRYPALIRAHQRVLDPTTRPRHRRRPRAKPSLAPSGARTVPRASQPRYLSTSYLLVCYLLPRVARVPSLVRPSTFASADARRACLLSRAAWQDQHVFRGIERCFGRPHAIGSRSSLGISIIDASTSDTPRSFVYDDLGAPRWNTVF